MTDLSSRLRALADQPPRSPSPVTEIRARGRRRRRAGLLGRGVAIGVVAGLVAFITVVSTGSNDRQRVRTSGPLGSVTAHSGGRVVTVEPGRELLDGDIVDVSGKGFPPNTQLSMAMCEPGTTLQSASATCDTGTLSTAAVTTASGDFATVFRVHAPAVPGEAARRCRTVSFCALAVAPSSLRDSPLVVVRLTFAPPDSAQRSPREMPGALTITPSTGLRDRSRVLVTGSGLIPGSRANIALCNGRTVTATCGGVGATEVPIGDDGTISRTVSIYRQLFTGDGFVDCGAPRGSCFIRVVSGPTSLFIDAQVSFDPTEPPPALPALRLQGSEPTSDRLRATVVGTGFPSDEPVGVSQCVEGSAGVISRGSCILPSAAATTASGDGDFRVTAPYARRWVTPSGAFECSERTRCVLAYFPSEGASIPIASLPLSLGS